MTRYFTLCFLLVAFQNFAQMKFWNNDKSSNFPKLEIEENIKTIIFTRVGDKIKPIYVFTKTPIQVSNTNGLTKYKMIVESEDNEAKIQFEISYTFYRQTNRCLAYIRANYTYKDKRQSKTIKEYFESTMSR